MIYFNNKQKAVVWILLTFVPFGYFLFIGVDWGSNNLLELILPFSIILILIAVVALFVLAIIDKVLFVINEIKKPKSTSSNEKFEKSIPDQISKKEQRYSMLTTYWGGLCEGVTRLENGEKFDTDTYYNKKLLKYSVDEIKQALIFSALKYGSNKKLYEACQITYSYLACFEKNVKKSEATSVAQITKIVEKYPTEVIQNDKKQFNKMMEEMANIKDDKKKKGESSLLMSQTRLVGEFRAMLKLTLEKLGKN
ncbi:hypothetical protein N8Z82_00870 [Pelagibacteraceae bacterium]|jgi:hypothetical protein|nr:hypothetical protein [Pelagibacteraceae bacterium]